MMTTSRASLVPTFLTILLAGLAGCSTTADRDTVPDVDADVVAQDLVFALMQIDDLNPMQTTVQTTEPSDEFGRRVLQRIKDAGFGIQQVSADQGDRYLSYEAARSFSDTGSRVAFTVALGDISASREYQVLDDSTVPDSPLAIKGAAEQTLGLHEELFVGAPAIDPSVSEVAFADRSVPTVIDLDTGEVTAYRDDSGQAVSVLVPVAPNAFGDAVKRNIHGTLRSNYAQIFDSYEDLRRDVLVFANDSLQLGDRNKQIIDEYVAQMDPDSDVISVVGCSHGKSAIEQGNAVLALGRANRVKEGLIYAGVNHKQVLEEGCWAPSHYDEFMPRRGVVMVLKRRKSVG